MSQSTLDQWFSDPVDLSLHLRRRKATRVSMDCEMKPLFPKTTVNKEPIHRVVVKKSKPIDPQDLLVLKRLEKWLDRNDFGI